MTTPMIPVNSSQISYIGYDGEEQSLYITFKNGSTYRYEDVPKYQFDNLKSANSIGRYFGDYIKEIYSYIKIK